MITKKLHGSPIMVDLLSTKPKQGNKTYKLQVTFDCGTYNDIIVLEYQSEADVMKAYEMWQELITVARSYIYELDPTK